MGMKDIEKSTIGLTYVYYGIFHMHRHWFHAQQW
jgi:hypothetical protein